MQAADVIIAEPIGAEPVVAESVVAPAIDTAAETIPTLQQQIEKTEKQINLLLGKNPGEVIQHLLHGYLLAERSIVDAWTLGLRT